MEIKAEEIISSNNYKACLLWKLLLSLPTKKLIFGIKKVKNPGFPPKTNSVEIKPLRDNRLQTTSHFYNLGRTLEKKMLKARKRNPSGERKENSLVQWRKKKFLE